MGTFKKVMKINSLVSTDVSKETLKKNEELWNKIGGLIRSITNSSNKYDKKFKFKFKFNSDDDLPLKKTLELYNMIIVVRSVSHGHNKYSEADLGLLQHPRWSAL